MYLSIGTIFECWTHDIGQSLVSRQSVSIALTARKEGDSVHTLQYQWRTLKPDVDLSIRSQSTEAVQGAKPDGQHYSTL